MVLQNDAEIPMNQIQVQRRFLGASVTNDSYTYNEEVTIEISATHKKIWRIRH